MTMISSTLSIKGQVSISFVTQKIDMTAERIWTIIRKLLQLYPRKINIVFALNRGTSEKTDVPPGGVVEMIPDMISGCIKTNNLNIACGRTMTLALGECYQYTIPFGVGASDVGHTTIILPLPFKTEGCYLLSSSFSGKIGKRGNKENYALEMDMELWIGSLSQTQYEDGIKEGYKIYPFKLEHPNWFAQDTGSESDWTSGQSDEEDADEAMKHITEPSKKKPSIRGILKSTAKSYLGKRRAAYLEGPKLRKPTAPPEEHDPQALSDGGHEIGNAAMSSQEH